MGIATFDYSKLIGVPWKRFGLDPEEGLDCRGVVFVVLRELRIPVPRVSIAPDQMEAGEVEDAELFDAYLREADRRWEEIAKVEKLGDILITESMDHEGPHVSILVDETKRLVLTSTKKTGTVARRASWARVLGAYRYRRAR